MEKKCTVYRTMNFMGKKWSVLILLELYKGESDWKRYSELKRKIPDITPKILSARLKELAAEDIIKKRVDASSFPVKSEYSLSRAGKEFISVIQGMKQWALKWKVRNKVCENTNCRECFL